MAIGQVKSIWPILSSSSIPTRCCCAPLLLCADGFGSTLYSRGMAIGRVQNRWPPRATAALDAFLNVASEGQAIGYDMQV